MGHAQIWSEFHKKFNNSGEISQYAVRPSLDLFFNPRMKIFYGELHTVRLANMRTKVNIATSAP